MKTQSGIINIDLNKFINPKEYEGYTGIWVKGHGVMFTTREQSVNHYVKNNTNGVNPNTTQHVIDGVVYFKTFATNCFD